MAEAISLAEYLEIPGEGFSIAQEAERARRAGKPARLRIITRGHLRTRRVIDLAVTAGGEVVMQTPGWEPVTERGMITGLRQAEIVRA